MPLAGDVPVVIACHYTGPRPDSANRHVFEFSGPYPVPYRVADGMPAKNICRVTQVTGGSTLGYKYFNLERLPDGAAELVLRLKAFGVMGTVEAWLRAPNMARGGIRIGSCPLPVAAPAFGDLVVPVKLPLHVRGRQPVYLTFASPVPETPLCELESLVFRPLDTSCVGVRAE